MKKCEKRNILEMMYVDVVVSIENFEITCQYFCDRMTSRDNSNCYYRYLNSVLFGRQHQPRRSTVIETIETIMKIREVMAIQVMYCITSRKKKAMTHFPKRALTGLKQSRTDLLGREVIF